MTLDEYLEFLRAIPAQAVAEYHGALSVKLGQPRMRWSRHEAEQAAYDRGYQLAQYCATVTLPVSAPLALEAEDTHE